jgi:hypothetical protein
MSVDLKLWNATNTLSNVERTLPVHALTNEVQKIASSVAI